MSLNCRIDGVNRELKRLNVHRAGVINDGVRWYAGDGGVVKTLFDSYDKSNITGIKIGFPPAATSTTQVGNYLTYSGSTPGTSQILRKSDVSTYFTLSASGSTITAEQKVTNMALWLWLSIRIITNDNPDGYYLGNNAVLRNEANSKMRMNAQGYVTYTSTGSGNLTGQFYYRGSSGAQTQGITVSGFNTWYSGTFYPFSLTSSAQMITLYLHGYNGTPRARSQLNITSATWDGKTVPVSYDLS